MTEIDGQYAIDGFILLSEYVPDTIVPVKGIASCNNVLVETTSFPPKVLYDPLAMFYLSLC